MKKWKIGSRLYKRANGSVYWTYNYVYGELEEVMKHLETNLQMGITKVSIELVED